MDDTPLTPHPARPTPGDVPSQSQIGAGTIIEPNCIVGFTYHSNAGPAVIGQNGIIRAGTIIYGDVRLGDYFQSGHYTVIRAKVECGDYCTVSNHSTLEGIIRMGNGVRLMSHIYVPSRTWFGDHVFVGPGVTFLNDAKPGRWEHPTTPRGATIEDDVMIGGGCTILPGVRIGRRSFIAAGSLITKDVPPSTLAMGRPATYRPLPAELDRDNDRALTFQPLDLWHPAAQDWSGATWPQDWPQSWRDTR